MKIGRIFIVIVVITLISACGTTPKTFKEQTLDNIYPLLSEDEYNDLKSLNSDAEIKSFVEEFWSHMDPDTTTSVNELEEEYTKRLEYANRKYKDRRGWGRSDRKRIYLIYGEPDYIDREEFTDQKVGMFSSVKALEVWYYNNPPKLFVAGSRLDKTFTGEQSFIFADMNGMGVYKLLTSTEDLQDIDSRLLNKL
ncbi:MAG: hypothetical protein SCALA702_04380 [Melioribacteraceae bacterium]|nr:MAG: hypothetical protein SCALA702_04380 [Melioribacteraceae bacterium]